ncbi:MAG: tetratricopeptide repeat protein [Elusimicrobia bacterium]|nr:tetratricopeptide repeat protein [Elusimicrobiota bacterium]
MNKDLAYYVRRAVVLLTPILCFLVAVAFYLKTYDSATIKITLVQMGGVFLIALFLVENMESGWNLTKDEILFVLPVIAFFLWGTFSYIKSPFKEWASFDEYWRRAIYTGLFLIGFFEYRRLKDVKYFTIIILLTILTVCFYGFIQDAGLDPYAWKGAFGTRHFSTFGNPNFFGAWLAGMSAIPIAYFLKTKNFIFILIYIAVVINAWLTGSKGSILGLGGATLSSVLLIALYSGYVNRKKAVKYLKILSPLFLVIVVGAIVVLGNPTSYKFRIFTWSGGIEMLKKHPVAGTGIGSFKEVYPLFRPPEIFFIEGKHNTETDHFHNEFLEIFYDEGFIGIGIFLLILFIVSFAAIKKLSKIGFMSQHRLHPELADRTFLLIGWYSGAIGMLVQAAMSVHMRFVSSGHIFWLMLGVTGALSFPGRPRKQGNRKMNELFKISLEFAVVIVAIYLMGYFRRFFIADINHNIAIAYSKQGMWDNALRRYDRVITLWPRFVMAHYFMGNVFNDRWNLTPQYNPLWDKGFPSGTKRTDPERAISKYEDVKRLAPNYVQTHYQIGNIYLKMGKFSQALENFNRAQDIDPIFYLTPFRKGYCLVQLRKFADAEAAFRRSAKNARLMHRKFPEAYTNLANVLFLEHKNADAEKIYRKAIKLSGRRPEAYYPLLNFYEKTKNFGKEKELCREILTIDPQNKKAREVLGIK